MPAQWEGHTDIGKMFYIRYRHGYFSVCISRTTTNEVMDAVCGEELLGMDIGDSMDGDMTTEQMKKHTKDVIDWNQLESFVPLKDTII